MASARALADVPGSLPWLGHLAGLPAETYLPLLRPRTADTDCRFVPA